MAFDQGYKRLKIILVLFIFLFGIYLIEWGCFVYLPSSQESEINYIIDIDTMERIPPEKYANLTDEQRKILGESIAQDFDFIGFMTFTLDEIPSWIGIIFFPITIVFWIVSLYMLVDWIIAMWKAISPFTS